MASSKRVASPCLVSWHLTAGDFWLSVTVPRSLRSARCFSDCGGQTSVPTGSHTSPLARAPPVADGGQESQGVPDSFRRGIVGESGPPAVFMLRFDVTDFLLALSRLSPLSMDPARSRPMEPEVDFLGARLPVCGELPCKAPRRLASLWHWGPSAGFSRCSSASSKALMWLAWLRASASVGTGLFAVAPASHGDDREDAAGLSGTRSSSPSSSSQPR